MTKKDQQSFDLRFPVAFGSGLAAALLFVAAWQQGTVPSLMLAGLSPLPIMIATLGFGNGVGLGAALAAAVTIAALIAAGAGTTFSLKLALSAAFGGLVFALGLSLPAWWLGQLAGSGCAQVVRPFVTKVFGKEAEKTKPEATLAGRCPFGDILFSIAFIAFAITAAVICTIILRQGSYETGIARMVARVEPLAVDMLGSRDLPRNFDILQFSRLMVESVMPPTASAMIALAFAANLWLAGRVVQLSHRLPYPWPDIPHDLRLPRFAAPLFLICIGLSFLHGFGGLLPKIAGGALGILFALQGLATLHDLSRGMKFRTSLLCGLYLTLAFLLPWPLIILAVIGIVDAGFCLRDRKARQAAQNH